MRTDWEAAEARIRESDFDGAARLLCGRDLGIDFLLGNLPAHDLLYSTSPRGRGIPAAALRKWKAAASRRRSPALWVLAAAAQVAAGERRAAERLLSRAFALEADMPPARLLRAAAVLQSACMDPENHRRLACVSDLDSVLERRPDDVRALRLRAEARTDLEDFKGARQDLERTLTLDPGNGWTRAELADLLCDAGRFEEAWPLIKSLQRYGRKEGWYWALRGRALATSGQPAAGLRCLQRSVRLSPQTASAVAWRGEACRMLGRYRDALADFDRAIEMDPRFVYAYEWRARLLLMLGRPSEALGDSDVLVRDNPRHRYGPALRGEALFKLGRYREAAREFERMRPMDPRRTWNAKVREGEATGRKEREASFRADLAEALRRSPRDAALRELAALHG